MLKAVTRQASQVDAKIAALNSSKAIEDLEDVPSGASASSVVSLREVREKASRDPRRPDKITPAYFFDHYATKEDVAVMVTEEDFMNAHRELIPSVSAKELEHYQRVRAQFEEVKDKPVEDPNTHASTNGSAASRLKGKAAANGHANGSGHNGTVHNNGLPEFHLPQRPRSSGGRPRSSGKGKDKGKGKARMGEVDDEEVDERIVPPMQMNGFQDGSAEDDEDLY
jgi:peroxin-6